MAAVMAKPSETPRSNGDPKSNPPEEEWKIQLRTEIERAFIPLVDKAKQEKLEKLSAKEMDPSERQRIEDDYDATMKSLRRIAEEQFRETVDEREEKRRLAGKNSRQYSTSSLRGQQALLEEIQRQRKTSESVAGGINVGHVDLGDNDESVAESREGIEGNYALGSSRIANRDFQMPNHFVEEPQSYAPQYPSRERAHVSYPVFTSSGKHSAHRTEDGNDNDSFWSALPYSVEFPPVSRKQSNSSLSSTRTRQDSGRFGIPPPDYLPSPSRTMGFAGVPPPAPSPVGSVRRSSNASIGGPRSGLAISAPQRPSPPAPHTPTPPPVGAPYPSYYDYRHRDPYEDSPVSRNDRYDAEDLRGPYEFSFMDGVGESLSAAKVRKRPSASDIPTRRIDTRAPSVAHPASSPISPELPRTPDSYRQASSYSSSHMRRPESMERGGIPIPMTNRPHLPPQSSPDYPRNSPSSYGVGRPPVHRGSYTADDYSQYPTSSSPRNLTMRRQNSSGSRRSGRSVGAQSPRPDLYPRTEGDPYNGPAMETYQEMSATDTDGSDDWMDDDNGFDVEALHFRQEQQMRIIQEEAKRKEQEARRKEKEARRREEEAKRKEEEVRRQEEEVRRQAEEAKLKEEETKRIAEETRLREVELKRKEDELRWREEELRRREELAKRENEVKQRELELERRETEMKMTQMREQQERQEQERREQERREWEMYEQERREQEKREWEEREQEKREQERWEREKWEQDKREQEKREQEEKRRVAQLAEERRRERLAEDERKKIVQAAAEAQRVRLVEEEKRREAARLEEQREAERQAEERRLAEEVVRETERLVLEAQRRQDEHARLEREHARQQPTAREARERTDFSARDKETTRLAREAEDHRLAQAAQEEEDRRMAAELDRKEKEEMMRREGQRRAQVLAEQEAQRRAQGSRPEESGGRSPLSSASQAAASSPQSPPWAIPGHRQGSTASTSSTTSTASDRTSATSSSWESTAGSAWSGWSNATGSTHASTSSRASSSTPAATSSPKPASGPAWRKSSKPFSPTSASPHPDSYAYTAESEEEKLWRERQAENVRRQQEQFQRQEAEMARRKQESEVRVLSKEAVVQLFEQDEQMWTQLPRMEVLGWRSFPWPTLKKPQSLEDLTTAAIKAYMLNPYAPKDRTERDRLKDHIRRWHPDRFNTKLLIKVAEDERELVREGAERVIRNLNELLNQLGTS